jgi:hypothetical protein
MDMAEQMTEEEFDELADDIVDLFRQRNLTARDGVTILMMIAIRSCLVNAPSLSVAIAEVTKAFVMGLAPDVIASNDKEVDDYFEKQMLDNDYWMLPSEEDEPGEDQDDRDIQE